MSMVTLAYAKSQSRNLSNAENALIQGYLDAAELHAQKYLNRNVYPDQGTLTAALNALTPSAAQAIQDAYDAATTAANALATGWAQDSSLLAANEAYVNAQNAWRRTVFGMVINPTFVQAIVLIVASWWVNRETVITEFGDAIELPWGAKNLLDFDRRQMGA